MNKLIFCAAAALPLALSYAASGVIVESEPNNTPGTADVIARMPGLFADAGVPTFQGTVDVGDVDYFSIDLLAGEVLQVTTSGLVDPLDDPDTQLAVAGPDFLIIDENDDSSGLGSAVQISAGVTGTYYIAAASFDDGDLFFGAGNIGLNIADVYDGLDEFDGSATEGAGPYLLGIAVVPTPEPASLGLLSVAGLGLLRRRK